MRMLIIANLLMLVACSNDPALEGYAKQTQDYSTDYSSEYVSEKELRKFGCEFKEKADYFEIDCKSTSKQLEIMQEQALANYLADSNTVLETPLPENRYITELKIQQKNRLVEFHSLGMKLVSNLGKLSVVSNSYELDSEQGENAAMAFFIGLVWDYYIKFNIGTESLDYVSLDHLSSDQTKNLKNLATDYVDFLKNSGNINDNNLSPFVLNALQQAEKIKMEIQ